MAKQQKKRRGVRIPWVRDSRGERFDPSAIDVQPHPPYVVPLYCDGCGSRVSARHGNADDPDSRSSHYFKLEDHKADCTYDLVQRGKHLVETSKSTVVRKLGQWRLLCPPLQHTGAGTRAPGPPGRARPAAPGGGGKPVTSEKSGPAIASARRIVQLLNDFENDPDVVAEFAATAPNGRGNIPWEAFCYSRTTADQLAQALLKKNDAAHGIPHAVWGPASMVDAVAGKAGESYVVQYVARNPVDIDGRRVKLIVALRSTNPEWIGVGTRSGQCLGYGHWRLFGLERARERGRIELQLWVNEPWQVQRWDLDFSVAGITPAATPARRALRPGRAGPPPRRRAPAAAPTTRRADSPAPAADPVPGPPEMDVQDAHADSPTAGPLSIVPPAADPPEQEVVSAASPLTPTVPEPQAPLVPPPPGYPPTVPGDEAPRSEQPPPFPPLPPFPPPEPGEDGRRSALGRWLRMLRRSDPSSR
ncbi:hypothetical protein [Streptomyces sp. NPDC127190]|uniref:hypothetical protein n=1 Tax=unclassified Streptomyces TaxID=2593676 RepID=UPI003644FFCB